MTVAELEHFRDLLIGREENLKFLLDGSSLDDAHSAKAQEVLSEIKNALERIESENYGECKVCLGVVENERLEVQPASQICLDCITQEERTKLEEDLNLASRIHRALLPQVVAKIDGFEVAVKSLAARIIGGDYYDFIPGRQDNSTRIVIADTMGKGLPAGLLMSNVQGALRILADDIHSPANLISRLNQWICRNVPVTKFISLICLNVNTGANGGFSYVNAGHCPPALIHQDGTIERLQPTGAVLGVSEDFSFGEADSSFKNGDLMLLFTDGVTEAADSSGEMFEEDRLFSYVTNHSKESPSELVAGLLNEIREFTGRQDFDDDLTVVVIRRNE